MGLFNYIIWAREGNTFEISSRVDASLKAVEQGTCKTTRYDAKGLFPRPLFDYPRNNGIRRLVFLDVAYRRD